MKLEKVTNVETNVVELEISVGSEEFQPAVEAAYKKNIGKMNVPGFRKGHAPRKMVEKMYGEGVFFEDAVNALYPKAYSDAVAEAKIKPCDRADIDVTKMDKDGFTFTAKVTVMPEVTVKNYKGIKVEKISNAVSDKDVDEELARFQQRQSRLVDVEDRKTENGDTAVFDFEGFVDGKPFDGGKAENYSLKLGSGQFIPGFEDQMIGKDAGEEFSVNVKFPEEYTEELKGKDAEFKIKLHSIKKEELPDIDDELAKDVSEFDTLAEFKEDIRKKLQERKDSAVENDIAEKLSNALADCVEGEIPECLYAQEVESSMQNFERRLSSQGMNMQSYMQYTGQDMETMKTMFRPGAERDVKVRLALEKISEEEHVIVDESDVEEEYKKLAENFKMEVEQIKSEEITEHLMKDIALQKAYDVVKASAEITEASEKPAEKKPATKKTAAKKDDEAAEKKPAAKKTTTAKKTTAKKPAAKKTEDK